MEPFLFLVAFVASVGVFFVSFFLHAILSYHNSDYKYLQDKDKESKLISTVKENIPNLSPRGHWLLPHSDKPFGSDPEFVKKFQTGPAFVVSIMDYTPGFLSRALIKSFLYNWIACTLIVFLLGFATFSNVQKRFFFVTGVSTFMFSGAYGWDVAWKAFPFDVLAKNCFDGIIYGLTVAIVIHFMI